MMIDFEDKMPAPPMSLGEKVFLAVLVILQIWGYAASVTWLLRSVSTVFQDLFTV